MKEEMFYAGIKNPLDVRKGLLESSKEIIKGLQMNERFKAVRGEKIEQIMKLGRIMEDIGRLNTQLKVELPKTELRAKKLHSHVAKKSVKSSGSGKTSEIERLEKELDFIDSKLDAIS